MTQEQKKQNEEELIAETENDDVEVAETEVESVNVDPDEGDEFVGDDEVEADDSKK